MADNLTQVSFALDCTAEEAWRLAAAFGVTGEEAELPECIARHFPPSEPDDPLSGLAAVYGSCGGGGATSAPRSSIAAATCGFWGDQDAHIDAIAALIGILAPSALPMGFTWAATTSARPGFNAYGGGYALITRETYALHDLHGLLHHALEAARG